MSPDQVRYLRAIEALRAGVPNRDVVKELKPHQEDIERSFEGLFEEARAPSSGGWQSGRSRNGLLLNGEFGAGKSHWLERLQHVALENNFIVSTIVLSKETPLHALDKLYRAAVESARAPDKTGPALTEITSRDSAERYWDFHDWAYEQAYEHSRLDPRLAATLCLFKESHDEEVHEKVIAEWSGDYMKVSDLKKALKDVGKQALYKVARPQRKQILERFEFLTRFFRSAGYNGWVILCDETEMVSRYSFRQRAKSYAHFAQLSGAELETVIPGLISVFTITKDYVGQVLHGRKKDWEKIPEKLAGGKEESYIAAAKLGMRIIERQGIDLHAPTPGQMEEIFQEARTLYSKAYNWNAPELEKRREYSSSTGMREYLRSWINSWDLLRLYEYKSDIVAEKIEISYEEDADLQVISDEATEAPAPPDGEPIRIF